MDTEYFKKTFNLSLQNASPLYLQLASYIKIQIQAGVLKPGDKMIPENRICEILNISRTTVRQAMNYLVDEGLLVRYRGRGSFIAERKLKRSINHLYDFTEDMNHMGNVPSSVILTNEVISIEPESSIAKYLQLPPGQTDAFHLVRLRCANGHPLLLENTYIPYYLCYNIEKYDFTNTSLYHTLSEHYSLNLYHANETIEAIIINKTQAGLLECSPKVPGYKITRVSHLDSGFVFEYTTSTTRADKCVFQLDLYKSPNVNKNPVNFERHINL